MRFGSLSSDHSRRVGMEVLLLFVALLQEFTSGTLYGPRFLTGAVGGSVTHQCFYSIMPANKHDRKFWCKRARDGVCYTVISTTGYVSRAHEGRVSLQDVPQNGTFMVTMTQLEMNDTGTYRCGIGSTNRDLYVTLRLTVSADVGTARPVELLLGELRGSVTVPCPPGDGRGGTRRFWCRVGRSGCILIADTDGYVEKSYEGRIFITPRESSGAFKVLINDLGQEDAGLYRCGTGSPNGRDSWHVVALQVTTATARPRRAKFVSGRVGGSLSLQCHHDPEGSYTQRYLCRWREAGCSLLVDADGFVHESYEGRIQMASSDQNGTYTVVMSNLREEDEGWYWCGARNGHAEHTTSVKLSIEKGTWTSQNPETYTSAKPSLPSNPAARSTATQRRTTGLMYTMSISTQSTNAASTSTQSTSTASTSTQSTNTASMSTQSTNAASTSTQSTSTASTSTQSTNAASTSTQSTSTASTSTQSTSIASTSTQSTSTASTSTQSTSTPLHIFPPSTFVTAHSKTYSKSSSRELRLLPIVIPALVLLICIVITILVLAKMKLQRAMGQEGSAVGQAEAVLVQPGLSPAKQQRMEEPRSPDKANRIIHAVLGRFRRSSLCESYGDKNTFQHE